MDKITNTLLELMRSLRTGEDDKKRKGGWIAGGVLAAVAMLVIGLLMWKAKRNGKKLAKLLHEKAVAEEKELQASADMILEASEEKKDAAETEALRLRDKIAALDEKILRAHEDRIEATATIAEIKSWDEVDDYLNK